MTLRISPIPMRLDVYFQFTLGLSLLDQRELSDIHTWFLQYPRDGWVLFDSPGIYASILS